MPREIIVEFPSPLTDKEKKMIYGYKGEVVRCKDCRYWDAFPTASATPYMHECSCRYPRRGTSANDFCSWGERRKDEID